MTNRGVGLQPLKRSIAGSETCTAGKRGYNRELHSREIFKQSKNNDGKKVSREEDGKLER